MKYKHWFASIKELNSKEKIQLKDMVGNEEEIYRTSEYLMEKLHTIPEKTKIVLKEAKKNNVWEKEWEKFREKQIGLVCWKDKEYPRKLEQIYDPPYCLYYKGRLPEQEEKLVAVVGARGCSPYGETVARTIGKELAMNRVGVVSGMALGVDAAAHIGNLEGRGNTYAILGCGVDVCYPAANRRLYQQLEQTGGVISEFPCGCQPAKMLFPMRNRIISGLAEAVIVVEARKRSGSLITADYALEQGKAVYAVPGRISDSLSYGTNWLLSQGASPFYSVTEFLMDMGIIADKKRNNKKIIENSLEKNERLVYSVLDFTPKHMETVIEETELDFFTVLNALNYLERCGYTREIYKNHYVKNSL